MDGIDKMFPPDVIERAKKYLGAIPGGTGAYSDSQGAPILREEIAKVKGFRDSTIKTHFNVILMQPWTPQAEASSQCYFCQVLKGTEM